MIILNGDKDGLAGRYQGHGMEWTVSKAYWGKGIGARWLVNGPYFKEGSAYNYADISGIVASWKNEGVERVGR